MSDEPIRVSAGWLALREAADAAARARDLVEALNRYLPPTGHRVIHDLGCGTGGMGRWLAPLLPGPQHWVLHDHDSDLLDAATAGPPGPAADGTAVTLEARESDIGRLDPADLAGATLLTASALLDLLTVEELTRLARVCLAAGSPALLTLSVAGRVQLTPADPMDGQVAAAFNAHQRRTTDRGRLLGPDAPAAAAREFARLGAQVLQRPSPWTLDATQAALAREWFAGWVAAACEQEPELTTRADGYRRRRLAQATAGRLMVVVDHADLLVLPGHPRGAPASPRG